MLPHQFKALKEVLGNGLASIQESIREQIRAVRDASEAAIQNKQDPLPTPLPVVAELKLPETEKRTRQAQQDQNHAIQIFQTIGTWLAFGAAAIYAGIAGCQLHTMNVTFDEIKRQTKATEQSAYAACLSTQMAQGALIEARNGEIDAHEGARATIYQALSATHSERARITITFDQVRPRIGEQIYAPYTIKNEGKSAAFDIRVKIVPGIVASNETPDFSYPIKQTSKEQGNILESGESTDLEGQKGVRNVPFLDENGSPIIATRELVEAVSSGEKALVSYGRATYVDIFGVSHWVQYCAAGVPRIANRPFKVIQDKCADYNQNDKNEIIKTADPSIPRPVSIPDIKCHVPSPQ